MIFRQIPIGMMQNFTYLIGDEKLKECAIVDIGWNPEEVIEIAGSEGLKITKIILTHYHYDHIQKINELALKTGAEVYFHEHDSAQIKKTIGQNPLNTHFLKDKLKVGGIEIKVIHTPGHTPGSVCLLVKDKLMTADTLFVGAIGRTDLPGGDAAVLFDSLQKIKKLDDKIEVYPGHDYGDEPHSTIGSEKKYNPYLRAKTKKEFLELLGY
jgi:hydroxyacylglutathione hydrolase